MRGPSSTRRKKHEQQPLPTTAATAAAVVATTTTSVAPAQQIPLRSPLFPLQQQPQQMPHIPLCERGRVRSVHSGDLGGCGVHCKMRRWTGESIKLGTRLNEALAASRISSRPVSVMLRHACPIKTSCCSSWIQDRQVVVPSIVRRSAV